MAESSEADALHDPVNNSNAPVPGLAARPTSAISRKFSSDQHSEALLELLRGFPDGPSQRKGSQLFESEKGSHMMPGNESVSASDLVASFMSPSAPIAASQTISQARASPTNKGSPPTDVHHSSDMLLNLLSQAKPIEPPPEINAIAEHQTFEPSTRPTEAQSPPLPITHPTQPSSKSESRGIFTYTNPFDFLTASSPRNRTPQTERQKLSEIPPHSLDNVEKLKLEQRQATPQRETSQTRSSASPNQFKAVSTSHDHSSLTSPPPMPLPDGRSQIEALIGIGADTDAAQSTTPAKKQIETVSDALGEVSETIGKEIQDALDREERLQHRTEDSIDADDGKELSAIEMMTHIQSNAEDVAASIVEELNKSENEGALEELLSKPAAAAVRDILEEAVDGRAANSWESDGDDTPSNKDEDRLVKVYDLPMRPFFSISMSSSFELSKLEFPEDSYIPVVRLQKEFDQIDRTLVTATEQFIAYGTSARTGGFRVIRQYDGKSQLVFKDTQDRIFNVSITTAHTKSANSGTEAVIGTSISGVVYWAPVAKSANSSADEFFGEMDVSSLGIVIGHTAGHDEGANSGQFKTRARKSSRHPEYFAIGRGKVISIIFPRVAASPIYSDKRLYRTVNVQRYMDERGLRLHTHKAGKDFTFSEDDTVIASLDKSGRVQIWDIRPLVNNTVHGAPPSRGSSSIASIDLTTPITALETVLPDEKAWPTSIQFIDKARPYVRGGALRYLLIGSNQNHTIQLWDLALGKVIQELNFPHDKELDAICSVNYHPYSGFLVVGHPSRNSIYLIHLSAPRYSMAQISQADYLNRLASKDIAFPPPSNSAIFSSIREYSFASKGKIRSLDLLHRSIDGSDTEGVLFELYVMHSKGITCVGVTRGDFGWDEKGKAKHPVDAEAKGLVAIKHLREHPANVVSQESSSSLQPLDLMKGKMRDIPASVNGSVGQKPVADLDANQKSDRSRQSVADPGVDSSKTLFDPNTASQKKVAERLPAPTKADGVKRSSLDSLITSKIEKKKKRKDRAIQSHVDESSIDDHSKAPVSDTPSHDPHPHLEKPASKIPYRISQPEQSLAAALSSSTPLSREQSRVLPHPTTDESIAAQIQTRFEHADSTDNPKPYEAPIHVITEKIDEIYRKIEDDRTAQKVAADKRQIEVLQRVSQDLSDNVEQLLGRVVQSSFRDFVLPPVSEAFVSKINATVPALVKDLDLKSLGCYIAEKIDWSFFEETLTKRLKHVLSEQLSLSFSDKIVPEISRGLEDIVLPSFAESTMASLNRLKNHFGASHISQKIDQGFKLFDRQIMQGQQQQSATLEGIEKTIQAVNITMEKVLSIQAEQQAEIREMRKQIASAQSGEFAKSYGTQPATSNAPKHGDVEEKYTVSAEQTEFDEILGLLRAGQIEAAIVKWLPSKQQTRLFDELLSRTDTSLLHQLDPMVLLSVAAAVSADMSTNWRDRLRWLEAIFLGFNSKDEQDLAVVIPGVTDVITQRLQRLYTDLSQRNPHDRAIGQIAGIARSLQELRLINR